MNNNFNYVIKSKIETITTSNGELFDKIEKEALTTPTEAMIVYNNHCKRGFNPIILKFKDRKWKEIILSELEKDIKNINKKKEKRR